MWARATVLAVPEQSVSMREAPRAMAQTPSRTATECLFEQEQQALNRRRTAQTKTKVPPGD